MLAPADVIRYWKARSKSVVRILHWGDPNRKSCAIIRGVFRGGHAPPSLSRQGSTISIE